jgi:tetratricopeptide (TPR) repeat protein
MTAAKSPDTIRIFIFGESAAMGDPEPAFGFGRILQVLLRDAMPGKRIEVLNVAVTAINSHVIREIARDCVDKQGDYWLVYAGNNEVVGPFGAGTVFGDQVPGLAFIRANLALKNLRLGQLLDALRQKVSSKRAAPETWAGMEMFLQQQVSADDPRMQRVYEHFESNLRDILRFGQESGAQVLVGSVPVNLKDCPPFASRHRGGLTPAQRADWDRLFQAGVTLELKSDTASALTNYLQATRLDDRFAELWFRMGRCQLASGNTAEARKSFERARDLDTLRFRADSRVNEIIGKVAGDPKPHGVSRIDTASVLAEKSPKGLVGEEMLYEHVHPDFAGNYWIARAFAEQILGAATHRAPLLSADECARRLAFTDFNRFQVLDEVRQRLQQPPFTQQLDHDKRDARIRQQLDSMQRASLTNAFQIYESAIARTPEDWMMRENFARLLQDFGEPQRAEAQWRKVIQLLPHYEEAQYSLGNNLDSQNRSAEAVTFFQQALLRRPKSFEARNGLGLALAYLGEWSAAVEQYNRAIREKPDFAEARVNLGQALAQQGQIPEALVQYQQALRFDSNNVAARINLGKLLARQGNVAEAIAQYQEALRLKPEHAVAHYNLANALSASGDGAGAATHFAEAVRSRPNFAEARYNLGLHLAKQGDNDGALEQFATVVQLKAGWADARLNYGVALAKARRFEEAAEQFQETLRLQPDNTQARKFLEQAQARGAK